MIKRPKKEVMELLKSGNFSVHYHDNGSGSIYENRFEYDDFQDMEGKCLNLVTTNKDTCHI